ncbi:MAG TPA: J domain-containing protein [Holophagaceae bacterium]
MTAWPAAVSADAAAFSRALVHLRSASRSVRVLALQGALDMALGRGTLPLAQNLALRTVVDALDLEPDDLERLFQARTGVPLPPPWDPSLPEAWLGREGAGPGGTWDDGGPHPEPAPAPPRDDRIERIKALAMLGLEEGATPAEVKQAFLRISRVHHPDHYVSLGPEAAREADQAYRRIKGAFEFLLKDPS